MKINDKHLCAFANSNAPIDQEGYLLKRGEVNRAFQRRWFLLKGNLLFYFDRKGDKEPIGVIILEGCTVELSESMDSFAFQINFEGSSSRAYVLAAETQENMEKWMKAITCAGYDYMKLMVSELQRQIDELNAAEHYKLTTVPAQTQQELMRQNDDKILRHSDHKSSASGQSDGRQELLIDISDLETSHNVKHDKRQARINPFDADPNADIFGSTPIQLEAGKRVTQSDEPRNFDRMHADFGFYIQQKVRDNLS